MDYRRLIFIIIIIIHWPDIGSKMCIQTHFGQITIQNWHIIIEVLIILHHSICSLLLCMLIIIILYAHYIIIIIIIIVTGQTQVQRQNIAQTRFGHLLPTLPTTPPSLIIQPGYNIIKCKLQQPVLIMNYSINNYYLP